jgi:GNAT superfamily N-acetyltransferase
MLDKSIPYYNIIMKRNPGTPVAEPLLPKGYMFVPYCEGDEESWAEIETSVGEFDSIPEALKYFNVNYLTHLKDLMNRSFFIATTSGEKVATATCWQRYYDGLRVPSFEWIAVKPGYQGLGLGKAVVFEGMKRMIEFEGDVPVYLHTQTWSYRAVGIYLQAGFNFLESGSFGGYKNDYEKALPILKEKMK